MRNAGAVAGGTVGSLILVPTDLSGQAHRALADHFAADPRFEVIVDHRRRERRAGRERRRGNGNSPSGIDRRRIKGPGGFRVAERRARLRSIIPPKLPGRLRSDACRLGFAERVMPNRHRMKEVEGTRIALRIQAGDETAWTALYEQHTDAVHAYLARSLGDHHEAEDLTQQTFERVLCGLAAWQRQNGGQFRSWLFAIAHNQLESHRRRNGRVEVVDPGTVADLAEQDVLSAGTPLGDPAVDGLGWVSDAELDAAIERLPEAHRQAFLLRERLGFPTDEIAGILGKSPGAVHKDIQRARRFLQQRLTTRVRRTSAGTDARC